MLKLRVDSVNSPAHTVNATFIFTYKNGTQSSQPLSGNTETGQGNLFPYLVAGNLTTGDLLLNTPNSFYPYVFNETVEKVYAGALRTINLLNLTITYPQESIRVIFYWDAQTGLVLDAAEYANFTSPTPSTLAIHFKATATNVWTPNTQPDYSLDASSLSSAVLHAGDSTTFKLDLASVTNFTGTINLQASLPSSNATHPPSITLNPTTLTLSASDPTASAQLTVSTNMLTNQGSYIITVNGTSGSINHQAQLLVAVVPPDFIININPSNLTIPQNSSKSATITITGRGGFTGVVLLQAQTQPFGTIVTANLNQTVITLNSTITTTTSTLTVNTLGSLPGTAAIYITANSGTIYRNLYLNVNVTGPDFRINANPASLTIKQGQTGQSTITLTSILGFTGPINLSTSFSGTISASLTNNFISLTPGVEANTTLTVTVPSKTPPGFAYVDVTGTSTNNLSHSVFLPLNITGPDFTFSASNTFLTLNAGQSANSTLTLSPRQGFSGTISLTTSSFSSNVQSTVNPQSVTLNSTIVSSTSQLTITVPPSTTPGYTEVTVTATSSNLVHYIYIQISVVGPDFSVTTNPSFLSIRQGGSAESTVTLSSIDNFSGNITLSASLYYPASLYLTSALGNSQVKLTAGGSANTTLTIQTATFTPPGSYYVQITATSGALTRYGQVFVGVIGPDFSLSASPSYLVMPQGTSTNTTIAMTSIDNLNGTATLFVAFSSPIIVSPNTTTLALAANSTSTATFKLSVPANTIPGYYYVHMTGYLGSVTHDFYIQIQVTGPDFTIFATPPSLTIQRGSTATSTIIVNSLKGFNGTVSLTLFSLGLTVTPTNATVTLIPGGTGSVTVTIQAPTSTPPGSYYVSVNANSNSNSSIIAHYTQIYVQVTGPDFSIQSNPYFLIIQAGQSGQSTIQLISLDGFSGNITLTTNYIIVVGGSNFTQSPVNVTLNPRTVTLASGTTSASTLDISSTLAAAGQNFTIFITATSNNETHYTQVYVSIIGPSFRLSANQNFLIIPAGGSATTTITATSIDGFSGNLSLSVASFSGFQVSLTPENITLTSGGSANSTLSITVPSSAASNWYYNVVVTATSSGITRSTYITVLVIAPSFSITANPIFLNLAPGTTGKATLTLTGSNGFSGKISLFSSSTPTGLETSITPSIVTLNSTLTSTTADLTITVPANTSPGFCNLNHDNLSRTQHLRRTLRDNDHRIPSNQLQHNKPRTHHGGNSARPSDSQLPDASQHRTVDHTARILRPTPSHPQQPQRFLRHRNHHSRDHPPRTHSLACKDRGHTSHERYRHGQPHSRCGSQHATRHLYTRPKRDDRRYLPSKQCRGHGRSPSGLYAHSRSRLPNDPSRKLRFCLCRASGSRRLRGHRSIICNSYSSWINGRLDPLNSPSILEQHNPGRGDHNNDDSNDSRKLYHRHHREFYVGLPHCQHNRNCYSAVRLQVIIKRFCHDHPDRSISRLDPISLAGSRFHRIRNSLSDSDSATRLHYKLQRQPDNGRIRNLNTEHNCCQLR